MLDKRKKAPFIVPVFIPTQGCPHRCVYCRQESITGMSNFSFEEIRKTILSAVNSERFPHSKEKEIGFFGGTFTGLPVGTMLQLLDIANNFIEKGIFDSIRISTRPDYISSPMLHLLYMKNVKTIEIGIQSMTDDVLKASNRGYDSKTAIAASTLIKSHGFKLGIQVMLGLPLETKKTFVNSINQIIKLSPDFVRLYPTVVLKGTKLEILYKKGQYKPLSIEEALDLSAWAINTLEDEGIRVIRIGLHNSESLRKDVLAGPFHPSFGDIARSVAFLRKTIRENIAEFTISNRVSIPKNKAHVVCGNGGLPLEILCRDMGAKGFGLSKTKDGYEVHFEL